MTKTYLVKIVTLSSFIKTLKLALINLEYYF